MGTMILGYTIIALIVCLVVFVVLVNHNIIMKSDNWVRRFITNPLTYYSLKRIGSSLISIMLAVAITFVLLRSNKNFHAVFCTGWLDKFPNDAKDFTCNVYLSNLGLKEMYYNCDPTSESCEASFRDVPMIVQLLKYYYNILPFPKEVCMQLSYEVDEATNVGEWVCANKEWTLFDLGVSSAYRKGVAITKIVAQTMPVSFRWGIWAILLDTMLGYPLGIFMAKYKDRFIDKLGKAYIIVLDSIPGLVYYYVLLVFFSTVLHWKTIYNPDDPMTLLPPVLTTAFAGMTGTAYWVRRYMLNEFSSDYVKFARAKGLSENRILFIHILRNAIVPLSRSFVTSIIACLIGSFFIENIYNIGGFGGILISALNAEDYTMVQGLVVITAIISVVSYLISDISMAIADPRISFTADE